MTRASGFTLLEVMVAIVLTSLIVLLAYSAAQVSYDAHARLSADLRALPWVKRIALLRETYPAGGRLRPLVAAVR